MHHPSYQFLTLLLINYDFKENDPSNWKLVRRFFKVDKVSSVTEHKPNIIRFLKSLQLQIRVQNHDKGMIFPPLLVLEYDTMSYNDYENKEKITFNFEIKYFSQENMGHSIEVRNEFYILINYYFSYRWL